MRAWPWHSVMPPLDLPGGTLMAALWNRAEVRSKVSCAFSLCAHRAPFGNPLPAARHAVKMVYHGRISETSKNFRISPKHAVFGQKHVVVRPRGARRGERSPSSAKFGPTLAMFGRTWRPAPRDDSKNGPANSARAVFQLLPRAMFGGQRFGEPLSCCFVL